MRSPVLMLATFIAIATGGLAETAQPIRFTDARIALAAQLGKNWASLPQPIISAEIVRLAWKSGRLTSAAAINARQPKFGGGAPDGYALLLELSK